MSRGRIHGAQRRNSAFAGIGVGGKGGSDTDQAGNLGEVVALCDIDDNTSTAKAKKCPQAKKYNDFRKMFDEMGKKIDAVTVSTPDHTHAARRAILAMQLGKHVYCQKPLTHTVYEARLMRETAAKNKVCTQMGNQGTAANGLRRAVELIQAGVIGDGQGGPRLDQPADLAAGPGHHRSGPTKPPCRRCLHWDEFLGPAPMRPCSGGTRHAGAYHPFAWRGWWDFGTGALGDMACHTANMAFMALKLGAPDERLGRGRRGQPARPTRLRPRRPSSSRPAATCRR